jgi:hypothetical protein
MAEESMIDVAAAVGTLKTITGVIRDAGKIDLTQQVIDLQQTLLALLAENAELTARTLELSRERDAARALLEVRDAFAFDQNAYWRIEAEVRDGPYCSRCFDAENKAVRLTQNTTNVGACPNCKHRVRLDGPRDPKPVVRRRMIHPGWVNSW